MDFDINMVHLGAAGVSTKYMCAVLCCAVLCCAVLCCAVLCCAVLCCAVLCCHIGLACSIILVKIAPIKHKTLPCAVVASSNTSKRITQV